MRPTTSLRIPQPCHESWNAMTPTTAGRRCAACAKTVVDFTLKTDAEILAYLAGAAAGRTCGRFAAGQLERPLQRAAPAAPAARWRAWLAALAAVWAVREGVGREAKAQAATEWRARYWGGPAPATSVAGNTPITPEASAVAGAGNAVAQKVGAPASVVITMGMVSSQSKGTVVALPAAVPLVLRGIVTDASTNEGLPGVTVLIKGTDVGASTKVDGSYELMIPAPMINAAGVDITVASVGYITQERVLFTQATRNLQNFQLQVQVMGQLMGPRPWPWHPRAFYYWSKYWLTRPFRHN